MLDAVAPSHEVVTVTASNATVIGTESCQLHVASTIGSAISASAREMSNDRFADSIVSTIPNTSVEPELAPLCAPGPVLGLALYPSDETDGSFHADFTE